MLPIVISSYHQFFPIATLKNQNTDQKKNKSNVVFSLHLTYRSSKITSLPEKKVQRTGFTDLPYDLDPLIHLPFHTHRHPPDAAEKSVFHRYRPSAHKTPAPALPET